MIQAVCVSVWETVSRGSGHGGHRRSRTEAEDREERDVRIISLTIIGFEIKGQPHVRAKQGIRLARAVAEERSLIALETTIEGFQVEAVWPFFSGPSHTLPSTRIPSRLRFFPFFQVDNLSPSQPRDTFPVPLSSLPLGGGVSSSLSDNHSLPTLSLALSLYTTTPLRVQSLRIRFPLLQVQPLILNLDSAFIATLQGLVMRLGLSPPPPTESTGTGGGHVTVMAAHMHRPFQADEFSIGPIRLCLSLRFSVKVRFVVVSLLPGMGVSNVVVVMFCLWNSNLSVWSANFGSSQPKV